MKGGWGLTYANKTRETQVLLAGSTMKYLSRNRGVRMGYKIYYLFYMARIMLRVPVVALVLADI